MKALLIALLIFAFLVFLFIVAACKSFLKCSKSERVVKGEDDDFDMNDHEPGDCEQNGYERCGACDSYFRSYHR